jgi:hypothetical protein
MVENAVTRTMHHGGDVLNPAEKAPVEAALRMVKAQRRCHRCLPPG